MDAGELTGLLGVVLMLGLAAFGLAGAWLLGRARGREEASREALTGAPGADARLARLEQAIDAVAVEVERIAESQRFTAKVLAERGVGEPRVRSQG